MTGRAPSKRAVLIAGATASGKSALALALGRGAGRQHHQCRFHAGLPRSAHHHGASGGGGGGAHPASAVRPCRRGGELLRRPLVRRCARGAGGGGAGRAPAHRGRRHRALFQGPDAGACRRPADPRRHPLSRQGPAQSRGHRAALCRALRSRSGDGAASRARRSRPRHPRARGGLGDRALHHRLAQRRHGTCSHARQRGQDLPRRRPGGALPPHRCSFRCDARGRRAGGGARAQPARARRCTARHEGARRAVADPLAQRRDRSGASRRGGKARHPSLHQAPGHLVPPSAAGLDLGRPRHGAGEIRRRLAR